MNNPTNEYSLRSRQTGEEVRITRWGENDYDAYWTESDFSVRGSYDQVLSEVMNEEGKQYEDYKRW